MDKIIAAILAVLFVLGVAVPLWLLGVWLLWLIWGNLAPIYLTFLSTVWQQMPFWHFAGLLILVQAITGAGWKFQSSKS